MTQGGVLGAPLVTKVSRRDALSVPAVLRARNLICATAGGLPVRVHGPDRETRPSPLLDQPEVGVPRSVTMTRLYEDLLFDEIAWWRVTARAWDGYPTQVERLDPSGVVVHPNGEVFVGGVKTPDRELIRFDSPCPGLLTAGARAIRTCIQLDAAAARYAAEPVPPTYFTPAEGADPSDEEVQEALDAWAIARSKRATGYVGAALNLNTIGLTPEQIQLADSRQHAVLEIARATGVDADRLGVPVTSRTYANLEQDRLELIDFTVGHFVSAVEDRLSMGDVTPRGSYVKVALEGLLRSDALTRMQVYKAGLEVGALAKDEIRGLEDRPELTAAQRAESKPSAPPVPPMQQEVPPVVKQAAIRSGTTAFTASGDVVSLAFAGGAAEFRADPEKRTVSGLLLPFNVPTSDGRGIRFAAGSVTWQKAAVSRVKLDREHDLGQLLGSAVKVDSGEHGVSAAFKVARTPAGDEALALAADGALDGLSAVVRITEAIPDPVHEGGTLVTAATLVRATLTADPAFDDARLSAVALSHGGNPMPCTGCGQVHATGTPCVPAPVVPAVPDMASFTAAVDTLTAALERLQNPQGPETVPAGKAVGFSVTEPPVYTLTPGQGQHSMVKDAFRARVEGDEDARARLQKFAAQQAEIAQFAVVNRTVGANVIPPGYRPDLYQPQLFQGRPLYSMVSHGGLTDATPFTLPTFTSATGATATHVEGTNPTDGTLVIGTRTVTPGAISGRFIITREVVDASNPAIDAIALDAMQESYSQQTEALVYTELNGANGVGGTITSGLVPSGAAAAAVTGVGASGAAGVALLDAIRDQITAYPFRRFASPTRLALSQEASINLARAKDSTGRPMLPRIGAMNSAGQVSPLNQAFDINGLAGQPTWSMTLNTANDADAIIFNNRDVWAWESPTLTFRYEERSGPANIELALFGYFATRIVRPSGFAGVRLTVT
jgi:HK97 family phage major capsid protein